jgi:predicted membrane protein
VRGDGLRALGLVIAVLCGAMVPINLHFAAQGHPLNAVCAVFSFVTMCALFYSIARA